MKNFQYFLILVVLLLCNLNCSSFKFHPKLSKLHIKKETILNESISFADQLTKRLKPFRPLIGFYIVMLAPIYGIGFGPLGSITDFSTLQNRLAHNEYIVAPKDFTPARRDEPSTTYPVSEDHLKSLIDKVVKRQPRITFIGEDKASHRIEYVQRSLIFRFPDVITFQTIPLETDKSTLAVHSYSIYGAGDLGVNGNIIRSWLGELDDEIRSNN
jgi:uncharacterized protein (DUF1499 family)